MTPEIVTLCHSAVAHGGNLSILDAFNEIYPPSLPYQFPPFTLACRLRFESQEIGEHSLRVTVADIDGRTLGEMIASFPISLPPGRNSVTLCITFPISGMELRSYGGARD